jgi:hypothetical protein
VPTTLEAGENEKRRRRYSVMGYLPKELEAVMRPFETEGATFSEIRVAETVRRWIRDESEIDAEVKFAALAEDLAFSFDAAGVSEWGTHFGPKFAGSPHISEVTGPILDYWSGRCREAKHPLLRARYADLVWDFSKPVTGKRASHEFARSAVEAYIEATEKDLCEPDGVSLFHLRRALSLAISLRDQVLLGSAQTSMLSLFRRNAEPGKVGVWASVFDTLYGNKQAPLRPKEELELIDGLEDLLRRFSDRTNSDFNPWAAQEAGMRLAKHYRGAGRPEDAARVIRTYGAGFEKLADEADPLFGMGWLEQLRGVYRNFALKDEADRVQINCKAKGKQAERNMKALTFGVEVPDSELNRFLDSMTDGGLNKALRRIAFRFVVRRGRARRQLEEIAKDHPLLVRIRRVVMSEHQAIAEVGPIDEDPDGHVALQIAQNIGFECQFLVLCLNKLAERYRPSSEDLVGHLFQSPFFDAERRSLIEKGLEAYLQGDHTTAMHILIPQIEHAIRRVLEEVRIPTNKRSRWGRMQEKNIHDMLSDLDTTEPELREYLPYLTTLLADPRGLNLRNRLCHGLMVPEDFTPQTSALVFHALLFIAQLRIRKECGDDAPV